MNREREKKEREREGIFIEKEEVKLPVLTDDIILHVKRKKKIQGLKNENKNKNKST